MASEALLSLPIGGVATAISILLYLVITPFFSPLSNIPSANWSSGYSSFWILWTRWRGQELHVVYKAHQRLGPVVRLGPKDLSVACYDEGIRKIYGGGFDKPGYYDFFRYYGKTNSFSSLRKHDHAYHRKRISGVYTKSALFESTELTIMARKTLYNRFIPSLLTQSKQPRPIELLELSYSLCLDLLTQFMFGYASGSNFLESPPGETREWLEHYEKRYCPEAFWSQELPKTTKCLNMLGIDLMPKGYADSTQRLESWLMAMCDRADEVLDDPSRNPEDTPLVYEQVKAAQAKLTSGVNVQEDRLAVASELFDHMSGAREVLGLVLAYTIYYISRHPDAQDCIRAELVSAGISMRVPSSGSDGEQPSMPSPSSLDKLPYLSAVLKESFRMRPNSTPLPRVTPHDRPVSLADYNNIPPETRVNTFQWLVHRDSSKWQAVDEWRPERWLHNSDCTSGGSESQLWAFGSGPRMCVGVHFTQYVMRYILVVIFTNFRTTVVDQASFGQHTAGSLEDRLWL